MYGLKNEMSQENAIKILEEKKYIEKNGIRIYKNLKDLNIDLLASRAISRKNKLIFGAKFDSLAHYKRFISQTNYEQLASNSSNSYKETEISETISFDGGPKKLF